MANEDIRERIGTLVGQIAEGLGLSAEETASLIERGEITIDMGEEPPGKRFIAARHARTRLRIYADGVYRSTDEPS